MRLLDGAKQRTQLARLCAFARREANALVLPAMTSRPRLASITRLDLIMNIPVQFRKHHVKWHGMAIRMV